MIGIRLKIPDNEAHTALATLQRLAVPVTKLQRTQIWDFEILGDVERLLAAVQKNEGLFNANKHEIVTFVRAVPRGGEVWIQELGAALDARDLFAGKPAASVIAVRRYTGWRMFASNGEPSDAHIVHMASERLLCNPAIERAIM
ncbi:MAG: hypothetical protein M3Z14_01615 [Candidatus Eremiobacteraeota bacterium]|nr:hypothetical protein [Candidatus Eremiobacteraeota bacterium]